MHARSALLGAVLALTAGTLALPAVAQATPGDCRTSVTHLVDRPDGGHGTDNGGIWAQDTLTRTVKVCEVPPPVTTQSEVDRAWYQAAATDSGTFKTIAGAHLSPNAGAALEGGVEGTMTGGFATVVFNAEANFNSYNSKHDGQTYTGKPGGDNPTTGAWVASLFNEDVKATLDTYGWTYKTCSEQWVETSANQDGTTDDAGDITGLPCPTPTPSVEPTTPAANPPAAGPPVDQAGLPVTGVNVMGIAAVGTGLLIVGAGLLFALRRRTRFTA